MKNISIALIIVVSLFICQGCGNPDTNTEFSIKGQLANGENKYIYIEKVVLRNGKRQLVDSCLIKKGKFVLSGKVNETDLYKIRIQSASGYLPIILENLNYIIEGNADSIFKAKIDGGKENSLMDQYNKEISISDLTKKLNHSADDYSAAMAKHDTALAITYEKKNVSYNLQLQKITEKFIIQNPDAFHSLLLLSMHRVEIENSKELFLLLNADLKKHSRAKDLQYILFDLANSIGINKPAPDFIQQDTSNNNVVLSSFKGKYVLIDFWASWCGPCRKEMPELKKLYQTYTDKGFEIVGVSLDENNDTWIQALNAEGLPWINVSDLKGWNNVIARQYGVDEVPKNFLISPQGSIIAIDLHGKGLHKKLEELL